MATIRSARENETETLREIGLRAWEKAMLNVGEMAGIRDNARMAFDTFTRQAWLTITVIEQGGILAGWAAREALDELISDFWIDPPFQHQGLGSALLSAVEADIVRQGFDSARIETHARNDEAVSFFEKHGYRIHWLSAAYSPKLDREIQSVGLTKVLVEDEVETYGPGL
ncbi:ribosomal-protein-alanine N-acetyltransferase [Pseudorhizobium tarimense]|uniref:Ribosomal-protein-alanine N-acetyltransferase n=1 Tax=Pseudorhizobium tarimense TaxID=1079109 RepID=A0ABV2H5B5_9HYPH|nr:GNAT family N-acetyltransferase [Pseudorhizobium tarimense]MCJ8518948.1 GNAT family N-acetyltransferase [Pseudorhizobium tarimense]